MSTYFLVFSEWLRKTASNLSVKLLYRWSVIVAERCFNYAATEYLTRTVIDKTAKLAVKSSNIKAKFVGNILYILSFGVLGIDPDLEEIDPEQQRINLRLQKLNSRPQEIDSNIPEKLRKNFVKLPKEAAVLKQEKKGTEDEILEENLKNSLKNFRLKVERFKNNLKNKLPIPTKLYVIAKNVLIYTIRFVFFYSLSRVKLPGEFRVWTFLKCLAFGNLGVGVINKGMSILANKYEAVEIFAGKLYLQSLGIFGKKIKRKILEKDKNLRKEIESIKTKMEEMEEKVQKSLNFPLYCFLRKSIKPTVILGVGFALVKCAKSIQNFANR